VIEVHCFESLAQAAALRHDIDALNRRSARPDPFSTFAFFETWLRHDERHPGGAGMQLWFLAAFRCNELVGYVALKRVLRRVLGVPVAAVDFLVTHDTDRPHAVARAEDLGAVCEAFYAHLLARRGDWSYLEFQQQDDGSPLFPPPASVDLGGYLVRDWPSLANCTIPVRWAGLPAYWQALSKKSRSNLARQLEATFAAGEVTLLRSSDPGTTPALLALYLSIEPRSWKAREARAQADIGRHPSRLAYFRSLLDEAQPMRVSIQVLLVDGVPIAGLINGAFLDGLYALHIVYDDRAGRLAPGSAMLLLGMREAIDGGFAFFNLLSGFGYYKSRWLAEATGTRVAQIYRAGGQLYWRRLAGDCKRRLFTPARREALAQFNPVRRALGSPGAHVAPPTLGLAADEQARTDALVAAVRRGRGEFLDAAALLAVLPLAPPRQAAIASRAARPRHDKATTPARLISSPASMPSTAPATPKRSMPR